MRVREPVRLTVQARACERAHACLCACMRARACGRVRVDELEHVRVDELEHGTEIVRSCEY